MKTHDERAHDYARSKGEQYGEVWQSSFRDAFMAGAAAMAEHVNARSGTAISIAARYIIQSYDMNEAMEIADRRFIAAHGGEYHTIAETRPALDTDTEGEKEVV